MKPGVKGNIAVTILCTITLLFFIGLMWSLSSRKNSDKQSHVSTTMFVEKECSIPKVGQMSFCEDCPFELSYLVDKRGAEPVCIVFITKKNTEQIVSTAEVRCNDKVYSYANHVIE